MVEKKSCPVRAAGVKVMAVAAALGILIPTTPVSADPPPWAPAHGYRAKHKDKGRPAIVQSPRFLKLPELGLGQCNRELLGTVIGGGVGAAAGSQIGSGSGQTAAIIAGTIIGGIVGGSIGRSMDRVDTQCMGQVLEHAPTGRAVEWKNPDGNLDYRVTPMRTYQSDGGRYCREYTATSRIGGTPQRVSGTACRQPDGTWRLIS